VPIFTAVAPVKFVPLIVIAVPLCPDVGVKLAIVGAGTTATVKLVGLTQTPKSVTTVTGPVVAPAGTVAVNDVAVAAETVAATPLKKT
jgi:hypothetical protein